MSLDGTWALEIVAPDGMTYKPTLTLAGGGASGSVTDPTGAPVAFSGGSASGDTAKFTAKLSNPAPLELTFDIAASGDQLSGTVTSAMGVAQLKGRRA
jgi:hypothetical protein